MRYPDLIEARGHLRVLEELISSHEGGTWEPKLTASVELLCGSAARAVGDAIYQLKLNELRSLAACYFSVGADQRWSRPLMSGVQNLKLQIIQAVNALDTRLQQILELRLATANDDRRPGGFAPSRQPAAESLSASSWG